MPVNNLKMQAERLHTRDLKSEQSPTRTKTLTFRCDEWSVDLSKQYLDEVVLEALSALDEDSEQVAELASLTKARLNDTYNLVSSEGVQMHGGIGMTDEHEIGFFMKRSRVCEHTLGGSAFHRDRYGVLQGY